MPGGRSRSESVTSRDSPPRVTTIPFISVPSTNPSRIASRAGDSASAAWRCDSRSPGVSTRKTPRCPPESTGFKTAGRPTVSIAARPSARLRTAANGGWGMPSSARIRRIAILWVIRWATSLPMVGSPRRSVTAATTGTARSADTVSAPATPCRRATSSTAFTSAKSTTSGTSATRSPERQGCGRPRPRGGRAPAPGGSRAADDAQPRQEDARHGAMLDGRGSSGVCGANDAKSARFRDPLARVVRLG